MYEQLNLIDLFILNGFYFGAQIIYAWARDAPKLELPDGVGFKVGKTSPIKYIILQVHYMHEFRGNMSIW